jgi:hypothetical protein
VKEKILFPFFRKYFPKRDRELTALDEQMRHLKENLREIMVLIHQTFNNEKLPQNEYSARISKIALEGKKLTEALKKYFESEICLFHHELLKELREDEAEVFFRKVVQLQNDRLNIHSKAI